MENESPMQIDAQPASGVEVYAGHTRIIRADGTALRIMDQTLRDQIAARRALTRDEETQLAKLAAASLNEIMRVKSVDADGNEIDAYCDPAALDFSAQLRAKGVRHQVMKPANDPDAQPCAGVLTEVPFEGDDTFIAYRLRFPYDRMSFTSEWTKPVTDAEGTIHPPAGIAKVAAAMQLFPVFLVRAPFWATHLLPSGIPIHVVSVKLLAMAGLYLTLLVRGYGAPDAADEQYFRDHGTVNKPFGAGVAATLKAMSVLVEFMRIFSQAKQTDAAEMQRANGFMSVARHMVWSCMNCPSELEAGFRALETRPTPRWFISAWRNITRVDAPAVVPAAFTDEMLQAPLIHVSLLHLYTKRAAVENTMFDALERGDMAAPFFACSETLRLYDDAIWNVLSICRNPDFPEAHRAYSPYNYYRFAKGLEPDFDIREIDGAMVDTRFSLADDGDWVHGEAASEHARYTSLMNTITNVYETQQTADASTEDSHYRPSDRALLRHAAMVAADGDAEEHRVLEIEHVLFNNLPNVMREFMVQKPIAENFKVAPGEFVRIDADPARTDETRMRAVATKYDSNCVVCGKSMPIEYDERFRVSFFVESTTRMDGRVVCITCI